MQADLFDALRIMKVFHFLFSYFLSVYGLQSVVAISNVIHYTNEQSPFNINEHWEAPYFTKEETFRLFEDFQNYRGAVLENGIVDRIYDITSGNQEMVCCCGKIIHEVILCGKGSLSLDEWKSFEASQLVK